MQNHLLSPLRSSDFKNTSKEEVKELLQGGQMISCLSSCEDEEKQLSQVVVQTTEEEIMPSAIGDNPFNSSK